MPQLDRRRSNPQPANIVGMRVRETRLQLGLSQEACAHAVQQGLGELFPGLKVVLDQSDLSRLESGKRPVWDYELKALSIVLGVTSDYLLGLTSQQSMTRMRDSD